MIITNLNQKGGVGKTTNTVHVASYYAILGKKVLLIDADNQCDLTSSFGLINNEIGYTILDFLNDESKELDLLSTQENLYVLPGDPNFEPSLYKREKLKSKIESYFNDFFDFIFIDVPPTGINKYNVTSAELALYASNYFICTIKPDMFSVKNLDSFLGKVFDFRDTYNPKLDFLGVYFSDVNPQKVLFKQFKEMVEEQGNGILMNSFIRSDAEVEKASASGETIFQFNPNCRASKDFKKLGDEILIKIKK